MGQANFKVIEKRLEKKNAELVEIKGLRQKLFEREKEITSEAIMPLLEVLRNGNATLEENSESEVAKESNIPVNKTLEFVQK